MRSLSSIEILTVWEQGRELPEQEAVLALLALACPERSPEDLANLPLGERNNLLLELRMLLFGRRMEGLAVCPHCQAHLEFAMDAAELARGLRAMPAQTKEPSSCAMRPANTLDLLASSTAEDEEQARCILLARTSGLQSLGTDNALNSAQKQSAVEWLRSQPPEIGTQLLDRFEELNAAAEVGVELHCSACHRSSDLDLDIAWFLSCEIASLARRLMSEIHTLASAYGWSEQSIATMSGTRRTAYLEMLNV